MPRKTSKPDQLAHPRYDRSQPLLRELAYVNVKGDDGIWFDTLLTRVPAIGEEIICEDRTYKAVRALHNRLDNDGRAEMGYHAYVDAELQPEDEPQTKGRQKKPGQKTSQRAPKI